MPAMIKYIGFFLSSKGGAGVGHAAGEGIGDGGPRYIPLAAVGVGDGV